MTIRQSDSLLRFAPWPTIGLLVGLIVAVLLSVFPVQSTLDRAYREKIISDAADQLQLRINLQHQSLLQQAQALAKREGLAQTLANNDPALIAAEEARIKRLLSNAALVRLIRPDEAITSTDRLPKLTFTALDLVNQTEAGQQVSPESIRVDGRWLLAIAAPIVSPSINVAQGTLLLYLEMTEISKRIDTQVLGSVSIMQSVNSAPSAQVLEIGEPIYSKPVLRNLDNPHWTLLFYPGAELTEASPANLSIYLLPAVAALMIALSGILLGIRSHSRTLNADAEHLTQQIEKAFKGRHEPSTAYQQPVFLALDNSLSRLRRQAELPEAIDPPPSRADSAAEIPHRASIQTEINVLTKQGSHSDSLTVDLSEAPIKQPSRDALREIFRAYDIRGIVGETLTPDVIYRIGRAIGSTAIDLGETAICVGADGRLSSPAVMASLIDGLIDTGVNVISIGSVPTPLLYYATKTTPVHSGVMVTASHNPSEYNGFKIVLKDQSPTAEDLQQLHHRFDRQDFHSGKGQLQERDLCQDYLLAITEDIVVPRSLRVVVDCGNGIAGDLAPDVYASLGCEVIPLYCEVDGHFPNHHPDPSLAENLQDLVLSVKAQKADLGIALDGDGDRMVAVTGDGKIVASDELLMLFAKDVVSRSPGSDVIYDVKCTRNLNGVISGLGGRPILCRSGHSYLKERMSATGAALGGEFSGHICFGDRWFGFDDGIYAGARLLEIVGSETLGLADLMSEFPTSISTPEIKIHVSEEKKFSIIEQLKSTGVFGDGAITMIDGIRIDYADGWGLIRASNTGPYLTLRFEADTSHSLDRLQLLFRAQLQNVDSSLIF